MRFMTIADSFKKVLIVSTFFVCVGYFCGYANLADAKEAGCTKPDSGLEWVKVKWIYDGDTLKLTDQRKVRIIGIDTPETAHTNHHKQKAEPYGGQATEALRELLVRQKYKVGIQRGKQQHDKYGRLLAHVFTPDGVNVSEWLLRKGLATTLIIPPNTRYIDCYHKAEQLAQQKHLNIWKLNSHQLKKTTDLGKHFSGYVRLQGTVKSIKRRKNRISITLDHQVYITIKQPDLKWFRHLNVNHLKGKSVQVTGILYRHGKKAYIRVRHPVYLVVK